MARSRGGTCLKQKCVFGLKIKDNDFFEWSAGTTRNGMGEAKIRPLPFRSGWFRPIIWVILGINNWIFFIKPNFNKIFLNQTNCWRQKTNVGILLAVGCAACRATNSQMYTSFGARLFLDQNEFLASTMEFCSIQTNVWCQESNFRDQNEFFGVKIKKIRDKNKVLASIIEFLK